MTELSNFTCRTPPAGFFVRYTRHFCHLFDDNVLRHPITSLIISTADFWFLTFRCANLHDASYHFLFNINQSRSVPNPTCSRNTLVQHAPINCIRHCMVSLSFHGDESDRNRALQLWLPWSQPMPFTSDRISILLPFTCRKVVPVSLYDIPQCTLDTETYISIW